MKILKIILAINFINFYGLTAFAAYSIESSTLETSIYDCEMYKVIKQSVTTAQLNYDRILKKYNSLEEGSEEQKKYKSRLDDAISFLTSLKQTLEDLEQDEFATYKIILDKDYTISKSDLITEQGSLDISFAIDKEDVLEVFAGPVIVRFLGADLCGLSDSTSKNKSDIAVGILDKIFN